MLDVAYLVHLDISNTCPSSLSLSFYQLSAPRIRDVLGLRPSLPSPFPSNMRTLDWREVEDGRKERFMSTTSPLSGRRSRLKFSAVGSLE